MGGAVQDGFSVSLPPGIAGSNPLILNLLQDEATVDKENRKAPPSALPSFPRKRESCGCLPRMGQHKVALSGIPACAGRTVGRAAGFPLTRE